MVALPSLVPRLSLLPRNNSMYDLGAGQRSNVELLRGRRESLGTRLALPCLLGIFLCSILCVIIIFPIIMSVHNYNIHASYFCMPPFTP